jgi:transposase
MSLMYCPECLKKQQRINELVEEVERLKDRLRYQQRTAAEGPFGSSTPSSKIPIKPDALPERQARRGGAKPGHKGHGRDSYSVEEAERVEYLSSPDVCPDCGALLQSKGVRQRTVLECRPVQVEKVVYRLQRKACPRCGKTVQPRPPGVLPKSKYANNLLAHVAIEHYLHGVTLGRLEKQLGVNCGSLIDAMHELAGRLKSVPYGLVKLYRQASVKHADETGWRNDGANGYGWLFCTEDMSIFCFRKNRSAAVVREVLGEKKLPGMLVVDRYGAYNKAPSKIQYCYSHLLRDVEDVEKDFPGNQEAASFAATFRPLLSSAISLRGLKLSKREFRLQAARIRKRIVAAVNHSAQHPAVRKIQDIFREKADRLYHWAKDSTIPADNNLAERELRPLVIARKISFGSQSDEGAKTREVLMTIVHTLRKRVKDPHTALMSCLDALATNPAADMFKLFFPASRGYPP